MARFLNPAQFAIDGPESTGEPIVDSGWLWPIGDGGFKESIFRAKDERLMLPPTDWEEWMVAAAWEDAKGNKHG